MGTPDIILEDGCQLDLKTTKELWLESLLGGVRACRKSIHLYKKRLRRYSEASKELRRLREKRRSLKKSGKRLAKNLGPTVPAVLVAAPHSGKSLAFHSLATSLEKARFVVLGCSKEISGSNAMTGAAQINEDVILSGKQAIDLSLSSLPPWWNTKNLK